MYGHQNADLYRFVTVHRTFKYSGVLILKSNPHYVDDFNNFFTAAEDLISLFLEYDS